MPIGIENFAKLRKEDFYYIDKTGLIKELLNDLGEVNLFGQALKTKDSLHFAVLTGFMRISKESIFTGLNNLKALSITDVAFDEYFGFMDHEVRDLLEYYQISSKYETMKEWYDGYQFGSAEVYCPWDVICYCNKLRQEADAELCLKQRSDIQNNMVHENI